MSHNFNNEERDLTNERDKYNEENLSNTITYEEFDTFAHSHLRENNDNLNNQLPSAYDGNIEDNSVQFLRNRGVVPVQRMNNLFTFNTMARNNILIDNSNSNMNIDQNLEEISDEAMQHRDFDNQLDEIYDNLNYLISTEKQNIKNERFKFCKDRKRFLTYKAQELSKIETNKQQWENNIKIVENNDCKEADILDIDVGGTHKLTTSRSTLIKFPKSALGALFSGRHELQRHNNYIFIDRDGEAFAHMINFLRSGKVPVFKDKTDESAFYEELDFWQIPLIDNYYEDGRKSQFDADWCAKTLSLDNNNSIVKKHNVNHGIVFCKTPLDIHNHSIEFKITMTMPARGKSHLFIGLVDKSKYKPDYLMSTFWKDSPSSYYWDVWNYKLIKTDENGVQTGTSGGYGCHCEEYETIIKLCFDYKSKSVSFYKNNINQGVAFTNVPSGLFPSLDLWFESGTIEIVKSVEKSISL